MIKVIKNKCKTVFAYRLGEKGEAVRKLIEEGKIIEHPDDRYEIMSYEAVIGGKHGEVVTGDDYVKIDSSGYPYPNTAQYFKENHTHISGDEYKINAAPLDGWTYDQPMCEEIEYLIAHKGLVIDPENEESYFTAPLWGTVETAAKDAVIVFYSVSRDEKGKITDIDFNFVCRPEFDKTYSII